MAKTIQGNINLLFLRESIAMVMVKKLTKKVSESEPESGKKKMTPKVKTAKTPVTLKKPTIASTNALLKRPKKIKKEDSLNNEMTNSTHVIPYSLFTEEDIIQFKEGKHFRIYNKLGAHQIQVEGFYGVYFAVWAPNAMQIAVIGNFNGWNRTSHLLLGRWDGSGIMEGFIPGITKGEVYKYFIESYQGARLEKGDPYANYWELRPKTASIVWDLNYSWNDKSWMKKRKNHNALNKPMSVYEVHLGSWKRNPEAPETFLTYLELAELLPAYCDSLGFTHIELMPVMEHPYDGSWGYQQTGYYATTSRFGTPQDFMHLVDTLHQHNIGIILDWVPSHFPYDEHGLFRFDGSHLYEHDDPRKGYHPDWKSYIFNSGRNEVKCFLISNALFWMDKFHVDGIRVDAVASMLHLDYSRKEGEWEPNIYGGRENLENVAFLKELNEVIYREYPDIQMIAEESTSWPGVSKPTYDGGLGFGMKWMMGWMNDTLQYFKRDPMYRKWHQSDLTFSLVYAFSENFMLPLSHDEVVHGKASMIGKMPGDEWQRFANLRLLYAYMWTHPGTKLLFMGNEFAQSNEWNFESSLSWHLLQYEPHLGMQRLITDLNSLYRNEPAMYENSFNHDGFEWIAGDDIENCVLIYARKGKKAKDTLIVALNFTPVIRSNYAIGVPKAGTYQEIFNSDSKVYWGTDNLNNSVKSKAVAHHGRAHSIEITIPPLGAAVFKLK